MKKFTPIFLRIIGIVLIIVGLVAAYYGPLEIFVFYLFSEGGRFYYDGFGVGSFWFAALVVQNIGYYIIAVLCLPVGIGHVNLHRWSLTLTQLYIWFWLGAGILLVGNGILLIPSIFKLGLSCDGLFVKFATIGVSSIVCLILLPLLALRFYKSERVKAVFEAHDPNRYWIEKYPSPLQALLLLYAIMIIVLHVAIFFQGLFPLFGKIMLGRQPAYIIAACILILGILIYGTVRLKGWAWWGSLVFISLLTISSAMSFSLHSFFDIILMMNLPTDEMEFIDKMILIRDYHFVYLIALPLLVALGIIIYSKRYFVKDSNPDQVTSS